MNGAPDDYAAGVAFIVRNGDALLARCAGPTETFVVERTLAALAQRPQPIGYAKPDQVEGARKWKDRGAFGVFLSRDQDRGHTVPIYGPEAVGHDVELVEQCESAAPDCGPVFTHDSEGVPVCERCWLDLTKPEGTGA